ncbi:DNA polymerase III subunit [Ruminococcus sp. HUN007]|uniref:DNA polymerase III subunit n=1 Tax=Ruminococcus sp. HUN007 TaxID=1514668 RepID=UPI0005D23E2B|nr:DNA polymerase III subunit [Ruminococcus sp. HUN007]
MKIYGNKLIKETIINMSEKDRMAHSFLICGEKGLGKKTIADWLAALLVCESAEKPCFACRSCHLASEHTHPDIIYAEHSGKLGGFSVDTVREICSDAYIKPNNGDRKIYIFTDADKITVQAQNSLLKLIEEPPDHAYFIFTVTDRNVILETIRSRVITLNAAPLSREELMEALAACGVSGADAEEAASVFGGNAGRCLEYISSDAMKTAVDLTKKVTDCIINRDEYGILKNLTDASADKDMFKTVIGMLDCIIRDALALRYDPGSMTGCYDRGARELSSGTTMNACERMHDALGKAYSLIDKNVNIKLIASVLCGEITAFRQL